MSLVNKILVVFAICTVIYGVVFSFMSPHVRKNVPAFVTAPLAPLSTFIEGLEERRYVAFAAGSNIFDELVSAIRFAPEPTVHVPEREYISPPLEEMVTTNGRAVIADLSSMTMTLLEDGRAVTSFPIKSKGKQGTPWETPAGIYRTQSMSKNHFSSIGEVFMPNSVQFFGNFFIHGWPYYPGGEDVSEGFSGGCIRLDTQDSEKVFNFVEEGVPIYVLDEESRSTQPGIYTDEFLVHVRESTNTLSSTNFLVADMSTGEVITSQASRNKRTLASTSKLMTAITSLEVINQYQQTVASEEAVETEGFAGGLSAGDVLITGDLLYPLLLSSSNDAAEVLAEHYGRDYFIEQMNRRAESIGLLSVSFVDPHGLSPENVSHAEDLFRLLQYIFWHKRYILDLTTLPTQEQDGYEWGNKNNIACADDCLGGKIGYTDEAGYTYAGVHEFISGTGEKYTVGIILFGSEDLDQDVSRIRRAFLTGIV